MYASCKKCRMHRYLDRKGLCTSCTRYSAPTYGSSSYGSSNDDTLLDVIETVAEVAIIESIFDSSSNSDSFSGGGGDFSGGGASDSW